jgi:hypothetical protein
MLRSDPARPMKVKNKRAVAQKPNSKMSEKLRFDEG